MRCSPFSHRAKNRFTTALRRISSAKGALGQCQGRVGATVRAHTQDELLRPYLLTQTPFPDSASVLLATQWFANGRSQKQPPDVRISCGYFDFITD